MRVAARDLPRGTLLVPLDKPATTSMGRRVSKSNSRLLRGWSSSSADQGPGGSSTHRRLTSVDAVTSNVQGGAALWRVSRPVVESQRQEAI